MLKLLNFICLHIVFYGKFYEADCYIVLKVWQCILHITIDFVTFEYTWINFSFLFLIVVVLLINY